MIIYEVFIDRFNNHKGQLKEQDDEPVFCGGTIQGIIEKLDYIQELGVQALWLTPFNKTTAYHGYHITDYFDVDERFGTNQSIPRLCEEAHNRGMKVYMDFVANHTSNKHPFFIQATKNKKNKYRDYYCFKGDDYETFMGYKELPILNTDNPEVRTYLIEAAMHWMNKGIDGFRLDHAIGPSIDFWKAFRTAVKTKNPEAPLFGEITTEGLKWEDRKRLGFKHPSIILACKALGMNVEHQILHQYINVFDGVQDFETHSILLEFARTGDLEQAKQKLEKHVDCFEKDFLYVFLDNHDTNRYLYEAGGDKERLLAALRLLKTTGCPLILYYGTEQGMSQEKNKHDIKHHGDLVARKTMVWDGDDRFKRSVTDILQ